MKIDGSHIAQTYQVAGSGQEHSQPWEDTRYTSVTEGVGRGVSCEWDRLLRFNELLKMVKTQGDTANIEKEEKMVEAELMAWCQADAGLPPMATGGGKDSTWVVPSKVGKEDEVEAMGE